ncbi:sigma-54-dependent Fis family transcriptional regulator [Pseudoduganella lurida]|nr:sigma-54-dependent Fis family transcriptional regulator [Pseudoduganella lurida]
MPSNTTTDGSAHVRRVRSVVHGRLNAGSRDPHRGEQPGRDQYSRDQYSRDQYSSITRSWVRCLHEYRLDPGSRGEPQVVDPAELRERQERLAGVQAVAKVEMANLYQQLAGSGYAIVLTDAEGVLLNYFGDPGFTHAASRSGLMQGAVWSERAQGTNGMGTCLVERRPVTVHQDEHYLSRHIGLSCAGAPIFDHHGEVVAALDASGESRLAQQHTLALVSMSVQMIENRVFLDQFRHDYILRFHNRPEFIGTLSEGAIALSPEGKVLAATRYALFQLGIARPADIVGRDIVGIFNSSFAGLVDSTVRRAFHAVPIFHIKTGARFYGVMLPPVAPPAGHRGAGRSELKPALFAEQAAASPLDALHAGDAAMVANVRTAKRTLERNVALLLRGETGTGKELFARAVHRSGPRADKPFVAINCAALPEPLIESELFGYRAGAFTGASKDGARGKLLQANGGTLFLDEIGDMPVTLQARLLRVLEEREVQPLGSETPVPLDIRVISATHCDLPQKIAEGHFREDLYYRLQGLTILLPPLRERTDRRELILRIAREEVEAGSAIELDVPLLAFLERQRWPGNLRQLRHLLRAMLALRDDDVLTLHDLPAEYRAASAATIGTEAPPAGDLNPLENAERKALIEELQRHSWNISIVARRLNMSRNTLYRKVQRLNIQNPEKALH